MLGVPYFLLMQRLGLLDTYKGLRLAYVSFALPFAIWLLIGFFVDVPIDVEEAGPNTDARPLYGEMSAAAVMVMLPNIVMTLALQRFLVKGLTLGAVKG